MLYRACSRLSAGSTVGRAVAQRLRSHCSPATPLHIQRVSSYFVQKSLMSSTDSSAEKKEEDGRKENKTESAKTKENETESAKTENLDAAEPSADEPVVSDAEIISSLEKQLKEMKEKVLRSLAEEENVRRIAKRDVENARAYANQSFAKAMLDVADDLERAMSVVSEEQRNAGDSTLKALVEGIEMTDKNLHKIFKKFGVEQYGAAGQEFDPNLHDALFQIPDASKPAGTIGQVVKTGYKLNDRVIRAAQVGAYVAPPS